MTTHDLAADARVVRAGTARSRWVLAATVGGSSMAALDATVVHVALPRIGADLDAGLGGLQWVLTGYLLSLASLILVGGSLGDRYGRRRMFVVGVVWFAVASLACGLAPTLPALVAARVVQGIGAALLTPASLAIIQASFHPDDRGRAVGTWAGFGGVAAAIGPFAGGWLIEAVSWRWVFLLNLPVAVAVVVLTRRVPETRDPQARGRLDVPGAVVIAAGLAALTWVLIRAGDGGAGGADVAVGVAGVVLLGSFVVVERRSPHPLVAPRMFASRQFSAANTVTFALYMALGSTFLLAVQLQNSAGWSPMAAGAALLPVTIIMFVLSPGSGQLAQRIGPRLPMAVGAVVAAAGLVLMARIGPDARYAIDVAPASTVFGLGLAGFVAPLTATVLAAAPAANASVASGINNAVARVGGLAAVAALPLIGGLSGDDYLDPARLTDGYRTAMLVAAGLAAAAGVVAWFTIRADVCRGAPEPMRQIHCAVDGAPLQPDPAPVTSQRGAAMDKTYETDAIRVSWRPDRCIHAAVCIGRLPDVFDPERRPWIDVEAADADAIAATVERCPTGALGYERLDGAPGEQAPERTTIRPLTNGPLLVRGPVEIKLGDGTSIDDEYRVAFCRCGATGNPPFCDGSHRRVTYRTPDPQPRQEGECPTDVAPAPPATG